MLKRGLKGRFKSFALGVFFFSRQTTDDSQYRKIVDRRQTTDDSQMQKKNGQ
jgi:hypothetical protein